MLVIFCIDFFTFFVAAKCLSSSLLHACGIRDTMFFLKNNLIEIQSVHSKKAVNLRKNPKNKLALHWALDPKVDTENWRIAQSFIHVVQRVLQDVFDGNDFFAIFQYELFTNFGKPIPLWKVTLSGTLPGDHFLSPATIT